MGALRSVMARLFTFFTLFHLSLTFFRPEVSFKSLAKNYSPMNFTAGPYSNMTFYISKLCIKRIILKTVLIEN